MPVCRTMGHAGSIDFAGLVRMNAKSGYFVDPDFPADDTSIWTEGSRSGFGVIASLPSNVSAWCLVLNPVGEVWAALAAVPGSLALRSHPAAGAVGSRAM